MFDRCGMAFSEEASLKPLIAGAASLRFSGCGFFRISSSSLKQLGWGTSSFALALVDFKNWSVAHSFDVTFRALARNLCGNQE